MHTAEHIWGSASDAKLNDFESYDRQEHRLVAMIMEVGVKYGLGREQKTLPETATA